MGKIITFMGADFGTGCTMISQSVSETLSNSGKKVLLLSSSGYPGNSFVKKNPISLDELKNNMVNKILSKSEVENAISSENSFDFISGNENPRNCAYYEPINVRNLVDLISEKYDYIILDSGADPNQPLHIGSVRISDTIFLVTTQSLKSYERYVSKHRNVYSELDIKPELILNKKINSPVFFSEKDIESMYNGELAASITFSEYGMQAEIDRNTLLKYKDKRFEDAIGKIVTRITGEKPNAKRSFFGKGKKTNES